MVQIQPQNYAHVSKTLNANYYMDQVPQHILPQMEEVLEYYLQGDPHLQYEVMDYWQVHQAEDMDMATDYLQDKLAVSNYRRLRTLQAPTAWTNGTASASN